MLFRSVDLYYFDIEVARLVIYLVDVIIYGVPVVCSVECCVECAVLECVAVSLLWSKELENGLLSGCVSEGHGIRFCRIVSYPCAFSDRDLTIEM